MDSLGVISGSVRLVPSFLRGQITFGHFSLAYTSLNHTSAKWVCESASMGRAPRLERIEALIQVPEDLHIVEGAFGRGWASGLVGLALPGNGHHLGYPKKKTSKMVLVEL